MPLSQTGWTHLQVAVAPPLAIVRIDRPDHRNALSSALMRELTEVARQLKDDTRSHAVILAGTETFFSAGADLAEGGPSQTGAMTLLERRQAILAGPDMCKAWEALEQITIAAIEGYCIGGGVALVLACDFRIMGQSGYMRLPEVPLGINMSWHALPRLTSLAGPARAKQFTLFGEPLPAETALAWGLVEEVVPDGDVLKTAQAWAEKTVRLPPIPVRMTKEAINNAANALHQTATFMDRDQWLLTAQSEDFKEGVRAFFDKRDPAFKGN